MHEGQRVPAARCARWTWRRRATAGACVRRGLVDHAAPAGHGEGVRIPDAGGPDRPVAPRCVRPSLSRVCCLDSCFDGGRFSREQIRRPLDLSLSTPAFGVYCAHAGPRNGLPSTTDGPHWLGRRGGRPRRADQRPASAGAKDTAALRPRLRHADAEPRRRRAVSHHDGRSRRNRGCRCRVFSWRIRAGTLLWDLGVIPDDDVEAQPQGARANVNPTVAALVTRTLKSQLAQIGYAPADITYVAISHAHIDHTANLNEFAASTWLTPPGRARLHVGREQPARQPVVLHTAQEQPDRSGSSTRTSTTSSATAGRSSRPRPGTRRAIRCWSCDWPRPGRVMLGGDLYHYPPERTLHRAPPDNEFNVQQSAASRVTIEEYLRGTKTDALDPARFRDRREAEEVAGVLRIGAAPPCQVFRNTAGGTPVDVAAAS